MKYLLEYIWIDGYNDIRGKTRIIDSTSEELNLSNIPNWNFDGSSTGQAEGSNSEVILRPVKIYKNPFINTKYKPSIILCDTWLPNGDPHPSNTRINAVKIFDQKLELQPWFGIEQEFFIINSKNNLPIGFNDNGSASPQGKYYCGVGGSKCHGRSIAEEVLYKCLDIGLNITGLNFEVAPGQCELQLKDIGIDAADELIILRYILNRTAEKYFLDIDYSAKPLKGDWNGSGCHVNFSTKPMREDNGFLVIEEAIKKLSKNHKEHLAVYCDDNKDRLTGQHETSSIDKFTYGVGDRSASIRIPSETKTNKKGYFEDRRPSSSMDPYLVTSILFKTTCLN